MLYTIAAFLIILWLLGLITSYTMGGFIHILIVMAIILILMSASNLIPRRRKTMSAIICKAYGMF